MARTLNESLSRDSTPITYYRDRLKQLDRPVFDVYRTKNEQVLATLDTEGEARDYITNNDYDPERVKVRENVSSLVSDENRTEVADLRKIRDAVIAGSNRGEAEWKSGSYNLYVLQPGSDVIEVGGKRLVLLKTLFGR